MLNDKRIRRLVDYENFKDIFPGVDLAGGACYFLWDRDNRGTCEVSNCTDTIESTEERYLNEYPVFIRSNRALSIVRKVRRIHKGCYMDSTVSASKPFWYQNLLCTKRSRYSVSVYSKDWFKIC